VTKFKSNKGVKGFLSVLDKNGGFDWKPVTLMRLYDETADITSAFFDSHQ